MAGKEDAHIRNYSTAAGAPKNSQTPIFELALQDYSIADGITGFPEGMTIYNISPGCGNFASFIGFNDETAVVYGSQYNVQTYDEVLAGGVVIFTMNADGSFRLYDAPTHFTDERWMNNQQYSRQSSDNILNSSEVHHIDDLGHLYTGDILNIMAE